MDLNYGPQDRYPTMVITVTENEDIKALAEVIAQLVPLGLEVSMPKMRQRIGFEDPDEGDILLRSPQSATEKTNTKPASARALQPACAHCGGFHALAADERDELDVIADEALTDWQKGMGPIVKPI
ncbi:DUF935 domain-containing protein, partial [Escherichia coli]|nr:DUF935 domain-containing protein [Escherichia coli]